MWCPPLDPPLVVTSPFGPRGGAHHHGTDYATRDAQGRPTTGLPVYAVTDAVVERVDWEDGAGLYVVLRDADGWTYHYYHLLAAFAAEGDRVRCGDVIAASGDSGRVTGPHLHFGVRTAEGQWLDPEMVTVIAGEAPTAGGGGWGVALALGLGVLVLGGGRR